MPQQVGRYDDAVHELRKNEGQWAAFESKGHCVVLAGPGSGKTKVLTTKLVRMLRNDVRPPRGLACVTYNNECARELERRLERLGVRDRDDVFVGTLHRFCMRFVLGPLAAIVGVGLPRPFLVAPEALSRELFEAAMETVGVKTAGFRTDVDRFRRTALDRSDGVDGWEPGDAGLTDVCLEYESMLRARGRIDFDDIVLIAVRAVESSETVRRCLRARFPILLVDEYQDLGVPLHRLVLKLCIEAGVRLFAVGDPDQSIYGFTGAQPGLLRELSTSSVVQKVDLTTNYRSGRRIVLASEVALGEKRGFSANSDDEGLVEFKCCPAGLVQQVAHVVDVLIPSIVARDEPPGEIAVLYPTQQEGDALELGMRAAEVPYVRLDRGAGYRRTPLLRLVEDLAAWCCGGWREGQPSLAGCLAKFRAFLRNGNESTTRRAQTGLVRFLFASRDPSGPCGRWLRDFDTGVLTAHIRPESAIEEDELAAFDELLTAASDAKQLGDVDIGLFAGKSGSPNHVALMNLHTAKGTEFNAIILVGMDAGRMPLYRADSAEGLAEQRRLFFVGVSRARREVHLLYSGWTENRFGRRFNDGPSPYVLELQRRLI